MLKVKNNNRACKLKEFNVYDRMSQISTLNLDPVNTIQPPKIAWLHLVMILVFGCLAIDYRL